MNHPEVKTIVFDWGNTLMQVFPEYEGPMVTWQRVAEVDGAHAALEILARSYRLVVATNAAQSSAEQVRAALNRVGLGEFIDSIYTVHELGARKPAPEFHGSLALRLGENPSGLVLVGDEFGNDVMGSYVAGWRSIWLNPDGKSAPALLPVQDGEITSLKELPQVLDGGWLPRYSECLAWLIGQKAGMNLLTHVQMVAAVAYALAAGKAGATGSEEIPALSPWQVALRSRAAWSARDREICCKCTPDFALEFAQPAPARATLSETSSTR